MRRVALLLLALGLMTWASWWWTQEPGPDLVLVREDAVATWVPTGAELVRSYESDSGTSLGKPHYAKVTRVFDLGDRAPGAVLDEARTVAVSAGWTLDPLAGDDAVLATRQVPDWRLALTVTPGTLEGVTGDLFVYVTAYPA